MYVSERLMLRRLRPEDGEQWEQWLAQPGLNKILSSGLGIPISPANVKETAKRLAEDSATRADFAIVTREGQPIGYTHLADIDPWARHGELGIFIGPPDFRGRGYGTEATRLLLDFAFGQLNLHKVWLTVDADNQAGIRCYDRLGFHRDGVIRDAIFRDGRYVDRILMSILDVEYLKRGA